MEKPLIAPFPWMYWIKNPTSWKAFHYADDSEFGPHFLLNPDDETQYSASGLCLDDGSDVYISGDVEDDSQVLCSDYGTYQLDFAFDDADSETKSLTLSQYDSLNNKINLNVDLDKTFKNISQVSAGGNHTCALTTSGNVKCWGVGGEGKLGNGANDDSLTPVDVHTSNTDPSPLSGITSISSGGYHSCALTDSGAVKCWGAGVFGKLGNGGATDSNTPIDVVTSSTNNDPLSDISVISSGFHHTCAVTNTGNVKCWGHGQYGKLGNGETTHSFTPVDVCAREKTVGESTCPKLAGIVAITAASDTTCALTNTGTVKCWGFYGQLGNGANTSSSYPVNVHTSGTNSNPLADIAAISAGSAHFCALTNSGNLKCWGEGSNGKLGNGATTNSLTPVNVCARAKTGGEESCPALSGVVSIDLGEWY